MPRSSSTVIATLDDSIENAECDLPDRLLADALARVLESLREATYVREFTDLHCGAFFHYLPDGEHTLEWTDMHADYSTLVERAISTELQVLGCSEEALLETAASKHYSLADKLLTQLLAMTDYEQFCAMMHEHSRRSLTTLDEDPYDYAEVEVEQENGGEEAAGGTGEDDEDDEGLIDLELRVLMQALHTSSQCDMSQESETPADAE